VEPVFRSVFAGPAAFWDPEREERVLTEPSALAALKLPTGRLAIHDPGYEFAPEVVDRAVPAGIYPVDLALRSWIGEDGTLVTRALSAAARVSFSAGAVDRFVPIRSSDGQRELVFGVDSGLISVFDRSLLGRLAGKAILDVLPDHVPESGPGRPPAQVVSTADGGSIFLCQAGKGDGAYRAWWGLDRQDHAIQLIVDFGELWYSRWRTVEFPAAALLSSPKRLRLAIAGTGLELEPVPADSIGFPTFPASFPSIPLLSLAPEAVVALRRPAGPLWEFRLLDADGTLVGSPGHAQLIPGPWFELFERALVERASTVRVRIHEGSSPLEPLET
jgi:uncharacterized protein DUF4241